VFTAAAMPASAQDAPRVGLTAGYPGSIGVLWHTSERTAVRPEFSFATNSSSSQSLVDATSDFSSVSAGISVLFLSPLRDNLKMYVAPRFAYTVTTGSSDLTDSTTNMYSVGGVFGGHYALGRRFALFGEAGLQYIHQTSSVTTSIGAGIRTTGRGDSVATRTGVGVVIYF
jgi:hypothetical protein